MTRQKLINLHNAGDNAKPKADEMEFGEIAVNHAPGNEKLWIKSGSEVVDIARDAIKKEAYGAKITSSGYFMPVAGNEHIGMQNDPWDKAYVSEVVGNLTGTASKATEAEGLTEGGDKVWKINYSGADVNNAKYIAVFQPNGKNSQIRTAEMSKISVGYSNTAGSMGEANLYWGGKNHVASYGPIDAAMVGELGANRFAFMNPKGITIEYSRNGGSSWTDYGATDGNKINLFTTTDGFSIGKSSKGNLPDQNCLLRITLSSPEIGLYTNLNKFLILCSTSGSSGCYCTIQTMSRISEESQAPEYVTVVDKQSISGWSGYNVINTSGIVSWSGSADQKTQNSKIRFIFGCTSHESSYTGLSIISIKGFGGVGWSTPSTMAKTGHLYSYDAAQSAYFPSSISSTGFYKSGADDTYVLKAGGGAELESSLSVGNSGKLENHASSYFSNVETDQSINGYKTFRKPIFNDAYSDPNIGNNHAYYVFNKVGTAYSGIGGNGEDSTIKLGCCSTKGVWSDGTKQKWKFNGSVYADTLYSNGKTVLTDHQDIPSITITDNKENGAFITDIKASEHTITVTRTNTVDCGTFDPQ